MRPLCNVAPSWRYPPRRAHRVIRPDLHHPAVLSNEYSGQVNQPTGSRHPGSHHLAGLRQIE